MGQETIKAFQVEWSTLTKSEEGKLGNGQNKCVAGGVRGEVFNDHVSSATSQKKALRYLI